MEQQTPKPCVSCVQGPCISDMASCRSRQKTTLEKQDSARRTWSTLLDLWHWDIINLFGQHVFGCDTRGSTNAGFRKVSLVFKSPTFTSAAKQRPNLRVAVQERTGTGKFAPGNVRWQMEDTHNAHRGQRDNMTCNVMTRENVHISLWSPFSMASWFFD